MEDLDNQDHNQSLEDYKRRFQEYGEYYDKTLSMIINMHVELEAILEDIIVRYFFRDSDNKSSSVSIKGDFFRNQFFIKNRMSLLKKATIVNEIITSEVSRRKDYEDLLRDIQDINQFRNIVAHRQIFIKDDVFADDEIKALFFSKGYDDHSDLISVPVADIDEQIDRAYNIHGRLLRFRFVMFGV